MDQRIEDMMVATSGDESAPENRFELFVRREFDRELAVTKLVVRGLQGQSLELTDARQLEILVGLCLQALPRIRHAEQRLERDWREWRDGLVSA